MLIYVVVAATAIILLWVAWIYNELVGLRNRTREAWSDIDTQLKRRHDLIPNLVEVVKGYAQHEQQVFQQVTEARVQALSAQTPLERAAAEERLSHTLKGLLAVAEAYPQLKANENFLELQRALSSIEDELQKARRYYNAVVRDFNTALEVIPNNLIARLFGLEKQAFFQVEREAERATPEVKL
jgi:LemA protein